MNHTYRFRCETSCGHSEDFAIEERSESIASVEAKIHVERWLARKGVCLSALVAFDLLSVSP